MSARPAMPVYFVVPDAIDDPARVSGGNVYDRHVRSGLRDGGWDVRILRIAEGDDASLARAFAELPDGALTLLDGLIAVRESETVSAHSARLRIVVLAHMVADATDDRERDAMRAAKHVITTSAWTRSELVSRDLVEPENVTVARPGTNPAAATVASPSGGRLLCVGVVAPHKGQDLLVRALAGLADIDGWTCTFVGSLDAAPDFVVELERTIRQSRLDTRMSFAGVVTGRRLDQVYGAADLVVVPSRNESFGMVIAEAHARGIPVLAARVGGIPEALSGTTAGILVPPEDPWALAMVLRHWWANPQRRAELKGAAGAARETVRSWSPAVTAIASTLREVAHSPVVVSA
jgi:glycosyltransferase involved in cell wall biosynthesis